MTLSKLAKLASVSTSTVSKVLSGSKEISRETAEHIFKIAEENGISIEKRRLVKVKYDEMRIAIIVPEIVSIAYSQMVTDLFNELKSLGAVPSVYMCGFNRAHAVKLVESLVSDGLTNGIICLFNLEGKNRYKIPIVVYCAQSSDFDCISSSLDKGMKDAVAHLKNSGHKRIGFIGEKNTEAKTDFFKTAMAENGLAADEKLIFISDKRFEGIGYEAVEKMTASGNLPTAIIAAYDEIALGAVHAFKNRGIIVPDDISIIGINNIPFSEYSSVPLTTIDTYDNEKAKLAVQLLLERIENGNKGIVRHITVPSKLIIRQTTAERKNNHG